MTGHAAGALLVALGGRRGAPARWWVDRAVTRRARGGGLPWGTLTVSVVGSLLLVLVAGLTVRLGTDVVALPRRHRLLRGLHSSRPSPSRRSGSADAGRGRARGLHVVGSVVLGLAVAAAGFAAGVRL